MLSPRTAMVMIVFAALLGTLAVVAWAARKSPSESFEDAGSGLVPGSDAYEMRMYVQKAYQEVVGRKPTPAKVDELSKLGTRAEVMKAVREEASSKEGFEAGGSGKPEGKKASDDDDDDEDEEEEEEGEEEEEEDEDDEAGQGGQDGAAKEEEKVEKDGPAPAKTNIKSKSETVDQKKKQKKKSEVEELVDWDPSRFGDVLNAKGAPSWGPEGSGVAAPTGSPAGASLFLAEFEAAAPPAARGAARLAAGCPDARDVRRRLESIRVEVQALERIMSAA